MGIERRKTKNYKVMVCEVLSEKVIRAFSREDATQKAKFMFHKEELPRNDKSKEEGRKIFVVDEIHSEVPKQA